MVTFLLFCTAPFFIVHIQNFVVVASFIAFTDYHDLLKKNVIVKIQIKSK